MAIHEEAQIMAKAETTTAEANSRKTRSPVVAKKAKKSGKSKKTQQRQRQKKSNRKGEKEQEDQSEELLKLDDDHDLAIGVLAYLKSQKFKKTIRAFRKQLEKRHSDWGELAVDDVDFVMEQGEGNGGSNNDDGDGDDATRLANEVLTYLKNNKYKKTASKLRKEMQKNKATAAVQVVAADRRDEKEEESESNDNYEEEEESQEGEQPQDDDDDDDEPPSSPPSSPSKEGEEATRGVEKDCGSRRKTMQRRRASSAKQLTIKTEFKVVPPPVQTLKRSISIYGGVKLMNSSSDRKLEALA